ncbi:MAG: TFIIB-type zinc ribbon-containing protein [Candidatus Njordarchaeia archaeon]
MIDSLDDEKSKSKTGESEKAPSSGLGFPDEIDRCPYCGSTDLEYYDNKLVCLNCGSVIYEDIIDTEYERRFFDSSDVIKKRTVNSSSPVDLHLHTVQMSGDHYSMRFVPKDARTRNTIIAISILNELSTKLNLPKDVKSKVLFYYGKLTAKKSIRRERVKAIIAALIYITSRMAGFPRPLDTISKVSGLKKKEINKAYKLVKETLRIKIPVLDPEKFILMFGRELGLTGETIRSGIEILRKVKDSGVNIGRDPAGIAAAAIYIATKLSGEKRTQKRVSEIAGVTEVTVRNRYREIIERLNLPIVDEEDFS